MQLNRLSHLIFPKSIPAQATESALASNGDSGKAKHEASLAAPSPGVLYTASADASAAQSPKDIANLSMEDLIALGKSRGVFNHITYTRNGSFGPGPVVVSAQPQPDFVTSAVNIMRDFQDGMATLKTGAERG